MTIRLYQIRMCIQIRGLFVTGGCRWEHFSRFQCGTSNFPLDASHVKREFGTSKIHASFIGEKKRYYYPKGGNLGI